MSKDKLVVTVKQAEEDITYFEELQVNAVFVVDDCVYVKVSNKVVLKIQHICKEYVIDPKTEVQLVKTLTAII